MQARIARRYAWAAWALVLSIALVVPTLAQAQGDPGALDPVIEWLDPLVLEETESSLAVRPQLRSDPLGGFIVIDAQAAQFRLYGEAGRLEVHFGRRGEGPGEFRLLRAAFRIGRQTLHALDADGRLTEWHEVNGLVNDWQLPVQNVLSAGPVSDSLMVVVTGPSFQSPTEYDGRLVRLIDLDSRTEVDAAIALPIREDNLMAVATLEGAGPSDPGATTAITWPVFDTIWVAGVTGRTVQLVDELEIDSQALRDTGPPVDRREDPEGFSDWLASAALAGEAFRLPAGGWLVVIVKPRGDDTSLGLVRLGPRGDRLWGIDDVPALVMVDPADGLLYFREPTGLRPNVFLRGRLRPGH